MKKKAKSNPKKPKKAVAKKPAPRKPAPKPAAKKPAKKKPAPKKNKVKAKPKKKEVKKKVAAKKPVTKKPVNKPAVKLVPKAKVAPKKAVEKPAPKVAEKPASKPAHKAVKPPKKRFIVLPTRPLVPSEVKDDGKKQKGLYTLEYIVTSSPDVLFEFISTAGGLEKWFAPKVFLKDNTFIFSWGNDEEKQARLLALKEREFVRFRWLDQPEKRYFEFRMQIDDLTGEVALMVSDFADTKEELEDARLLWNTQINDLLHALGSA